MKKNGMATHSFSAFDESLEIRILSGILESKRTIKTFFGENDKTPNHDGFFEILGEGNEPKKQFIVQVKKVENLQPNTNGKNKDKYVFELKTPFLYYIKAKVAESPAIYFVVDIVTENIFWLYLSDKILMDLNFEGKGSVTYAFSKENIIHDINSFTEITNRIANERNKKFINKSKDEIAEIQDSVEYINNLFNNDLRFIKNSIFPNLWRFGIAHSDTDKFTMSLNSNKDGLYKPITAPKTNLFALYPQIKGTPDFGLKEFYKSDDNYFNHFDMTGNTTPQKYVLNCTSDIISEYFNNQYSIEIYPTVALLELTYKFIYESKGLIDYDVKNNLSINTNQMLKDFLSILGYLDYILTKQELTQGEKQFNHIITNNLHSNIHSNIDLISMINFNGCKKSFRDYYELEGKTKQINPKIFAFLNRKYLVWLSVFLELNKRNVEINEQIWDYDYFQINNLDEVAYISKVSEIYDKWFQKLPSLYEELYNNLFTTKKYYYNGEYEYAIEFYKSPFGNINDINECIRHYRNDKFIIKKSTSTFNDMKDFNDENNLLSIKSGFLFVNFLRNKTMFYDSLRCLLYQGICRGLNINCDGIHIEGYKKTIF